MDRGALRQEVLGFGSCFTDTSAYNALVFMEDSVRNAFVEAMWGESGLRSSVGRMHINSPDYAVHSYNFDNVTDDFNLVHFDKSLTYDQQRVIPLIRLAKEKVEAWGGHPIRLFGSPWSPPGWMKNNNNMINSDAICLKNDTSEGSYRQVWANYILAWLHAYEFNNISLWGLTPQNEPQARQGQFESCAYDVPHYVDFVGKFLGPTILKDFPHLQIMGWDHNKLASLEYAEAIDEDGDANSATSGTAVHWYDYSNSLALDKLDAIHALNPAKFILATEACFLESLTFDFATTGFLYVADIIGDLSHWVSGWVAWNSVLLAGDKYPESYGGPNHDNTTHFGDPILFEYNSTGTQRLILQSAYWIIGHFSRFMRPGSFVVPTFGDTATSYDDFEAVRDFAVSCRSKQCPPPTKLPLLSVGYSDPAMQQAGVIVANPNSVPSAFIFWDVASKRYLNTSIPKQSIQTCE